MTKWLPALDSKAGPKYLQIAEAIGESVTSGILSARDRLPPQRELAYQLDVSLNTVSRAYAEAAKKGFLCGEVGRGTYVRTTSPLAESASAANMIRSERGLINFALNLPSAADSAAVLARTLETLTGSPSLSSFLDYQADGDLTRHLEAGATWIRRTGLRASSDALVLTNGAQHGLLVALLSLMRPGDVLLTEAATYAPVMALAAHFGLKLFPVPIDEKGLLPDALDSACRKTAATTLYCLPTLHTPTTSTMTVERREEIADVARKFGLCIIEDDVFGFLPQNRPPPVAHYAPERTIYVSSVSKSLAPGLRVGYLHAPKKMIRQLHSAVNLSCWMPPPLMAEIASIWIEDGTAEFLNDRRRVEAMFRQQTARRILGRHAFQADPCGMHLWLHLPAHWRPELFRITAEKRGVKLMTADVFSVAPSRAANAVRLCLSHEVSRERVVRGLDIVANLLDEQGDASALIV